MASGAVAVTNLAVAEDFVRRFTAFWDDPDPAMLDQILTSDVRLAQPLSATTHGLVAGQASFRRLFAQFPDLRATVDRWRGDDEYIFIDFRLHATLGAGRIEWPVVDRFRLRGEKACERVSYFDPLPLIGRLVWHPAALWHAIRW